jgi:predicted transcriptional regulator of viral defense system
MWEESALRAIAAEQHGLIARDQLQLVGITDNDLNRRLQDARLERVHPGVYYLDSIRPTWRRFLAAVIAASRDAVASHRTAATLWDLDAVYEQVIEITVPVNDTPETDGVILHRTRRSNESVGLQGIPVTPI